jgi:hypothetical protein
MGNKIGPAKDAVEELVKTSNRQDQIALVVVTTTPYVALHFDQTTDSLAPAVDRIQPHGFTASMVTLKPANGGHLKTGQRE